MWSKLRPTPAGVLACVALVVALGGPAMAEPVVRAAGDLVTAREIAPRAVRARHIANRQVLGRHVRTRTLTLRTLTRGAINALRGVAPRGIEGVAAGGDLTGTYPGPQLRGGSVGTAELANLAVTAPKLANGAVTPAKLAPDAVSSAQLADDSVTAAHIAAAAVGAAEIADGAVALAELATGSVDSARVVDNTLTVADLAANSVASGEIVDNTITDEDLASSSVGQGELQPFSVTPQKLTGFPAARVSRVPANGEQLIEPNQFEALEFFTGRFEKGDFSIHDPSSPRRLTAPTTGTYLIVASVIWETDASDSGRRELALRLNGSTPIAADTEPATPTVPDPAQTVTAVHHLAEDDYVEVLAQQTNGDNDSLHVRITSGGAISSPEFSLVYLGP